MYAEWMETIDLTITLEKLKEYEEYKKTKKGDKYVSKHK